MAGAIEGLNEDEQLDLVALVWIGRGDLSADEWEEARAQAADVQKGNVPEHLVGMPQLGDLLEDGLAAIGLSCEGLEIHHL